MADARTDFHIPYQSVKQIDDILISCEAFHQAMHDNKSMLLIDVREENEHHNERIKVMGNTTQVLLPKSMVDKNPKLAQVYLQNLLQFYPDVEHVVVYCHSGRRSANVVEKISRWQKQHIIDDKYKFESLGGGILAWKQDYENETTADQLLSHINHWYEQYYARSVHAKSRKSARSTKDTVAADESRTLFQAWKKTSNYVTHLFKPSSAKNNNNVEESTHPLSMLNPALCKDLNKNAIYRKDYLLQQFAQLQNQLETLNCEKLNAAARALLTFIEDSLEKFGSHKIEPSEKEDIVIDNLNVNDNARRMALEEWFVLHDFARLCLEQWLKLIVELLPPKQQANNAKITALLSQMLEQAPINSQNFLKDKGFNLELNCNRNYMDERENTRYFAAYRQFFTALETASPEIKTAGTNWAEHIETSRTDGRGNFDYAFYSSMLHKGRHILNHPDDRPAIDEFKKLHHNAPGKPSWKDKLGGLASIFLGVLMLGVGIAAEALSLGGLTGICIPGVVLGVAQIAIGATLYSRSQVTPSYKAGAAFAGAAAAHATIPRP